MDKIIAVDFDGTMCENKWPEIGEANEKILNYLKSEKENGAKLILWTNRSGEPLKNAVKWSVEHGIEFDAVNDNLPESVEYFGENSRKIYATEFIDDRASRQFRLPYCGSENGGIRGWAEREIDLACKRENPDWKPGEFDYGCSIYQSALKAYNSLMDDNHSMASYDFTKTVLIRLINRLPLTSIQDTDEEWDMECVNPNSKVTIYQSKRCPSLFKYVHNDGHVTYTDYDRYRIKNLHNPNTIYTGGIGRIVLDEEIPIKMPYYPSSAKYKVIISEYLCDPRNGDFDLVAVWRIEKPEGGFIPVSRYFAGKDELTEISANEFLEYRKNAKEV